MSIIAFNTGAMFSNRQTGIMGTMFSGTRQNGALKSTEEKQQRQQEAASQIAFWEEQKAALKDVRCETLEEIAEKLGKLSGYEEQISNVKMQYNNEQMQHALDEAIERGEQLHEKVEESKPKTPEERRKEMAEEALGIEDEGGTLEELLEEIEELTDELEEGLLEEVIDQNQEALEEAAQKKQAIQTANISKNPEVTEESTIQAQEAAEAVTGQLSSGIRSYEAAQIDIQPETYEHFDCAQ